MTKKQDRLSLKAFRLLVFLLRREGLGNFNMQEIEPHFVDGRGSIRTAMKELLEKGFVNREQIKNKNGNLGRYSYEVFSTPEKNPKFNTHN